MRGVSVILILGLTWRWASAQFLNHRPFPTYSLENMPETEFSCRDKILGGYYADAEAQCQMFHVCVKVAGVGIQDFRFLCPNGTAFDQDHQICAEWEDVDCDATTLYYSSDNFDLYRLGSGLESKAVKYGEDEETFSLQRAETGDARLNREHQAQRVNQQRESNNNYYKTKKQNSENSERDIFKGSSSSNFFNNRNNGKENDDDYDDNVNVNQDRDVQRRKIVRTQQKRPVENSKQNNVNNKSTQNNVQQQQRSESQTSRPQRPTGFVNNFAGSSYIPTTTVRASTTIKTDQITQNTRGRQRSRTDQERQYNVDSQRIQNVNSPVPAYSISTPAPFKQTQQYNRQNTNFAEQTTPILKETTENYPTSNTQQKTKGSYTTSNVNTQTYHQQFSSQKTKQTENYSTTAQYDVQKVKQNDNFSPTNTQYKQSTPYKSTENYPSNNPQYNNFNKKITTPLIQNENYPTTYAPKSKQGSTNFNNQRITDNFPTTFAPRTNTGYTQISQQTTQYKASTVNGQQNNQKSSSQNNPSTYPQEQFSTQGRKQTSTPKTTPFTKYTPTVPKITSTTPVARSSRFDETQYDDGSYNSKYDYNSDKREDEFLKTAHSQNIATSGNEYIKSTKNAISASTQKPYYESPRPFSVSSNTPDITVNPKYTTPTGKNVQSQQKPIASQKQPPVSPKTKIVKDVSYDYAYYDSNVGNEPEYEIDTELKKSTVSN